MTATSTPSPVAPFRHALRTPTACCAFMSDVGSLDAS
jgi:hypothetical protein